MCTRLELGGATETSHAREASVFPRTAVLADTGRVTPSALGSAAWCLALIPSWGFGILWRESSYRSKLVLFLEIRLSRPQLPETYSEDETEKVPCLSPSWSEGESGSFGAGAKLGPRELVKSQAPAKHCRGVQPERVSFGTLVTFHLILPIVHLSVVTQQS